MLERLLRGLIPIAALLALLQPAVGAHAEGPGTGGRRVMMQDERAGPYLVRVVTSPNPPRVGNLYVEVRVTDADSGRALTDLDVYAKADPTEGQGKPIAAQASHDIAPIVTEYAAHLPVESTGIWRVTIEIDGPQGHGEVSFLSRVSGSAAVGSVIAVGLPFAGLALLILVFVWLQRTSNAAEQA